MLCTVEGSSRGPTCSMMKPPLTLFAEAFLSTPVSQVNCLHFLTVSFCYDPIWGPGCPWSHPCSLRSPVLTQKGPASTFSDRSPFRDLMVCPLHHGTAFPGHLLLSILAMLLSVSYSQQSDRGLPDTTCQSSPDTEERTQAQGSAALFQAISPRPCHQPDLQHLYTEQSFLDSSSYLV